MALTCNFSLRIPTNHNLKAKIPGEHNEQRKKIDNIFDDNGLKCLFIWISSQQLFLDTDIFQKFSIIIFEKFQGINPMGLSASLADYLKKLYNY